MLCDCVHTLMRAACAPRAGALACALLAAAQPPAVHAVLPDEINAIRLRGCDGRPPTRVLLQASRALDDAAQRLANGSELRVALAAAGYQAERTASIHIATAGGELGAARLLQQNFCAQISDAMLREIGFAHRAADLWIILALPFSTPRTADAGTVAGRVLELVNQARAQSRYCGVNLYNATSALKLSPQLAEAAVAHSVDMATRGYFDHRSPDGSTPAARVAHAGYAWTVVAENIAAGVATPEEAVQGWLQSAGHCENLMDPRFTDMGVGYAVNSKSTSIIMWTQVFAAPRAAARTAR